MDSKKVIEALVKLATKQQKIIEKLADQMAPVPPQNLPAPPHVTDPVEAIKADPGYARVANLIGMMEPRGTQLVVTFKPGATNGTVDALQQIANKLQPALQVTPKQSA